MVLGFVYLVRFRFQDVLESSESNTAPKTAEEIFQHHFRTLGKIANDYGLAALQRHRDNIDNVLVISLFSGLGGAELMMLNNYVACKRLCIEKGITPPRPPRVLIKHSCHC